MAEQPPPPPRPGGGGLSLYADLLDPPADSSASISRAPVVSHEALSAVKDQEAAAAATKKPIVNPALHFQPIRRPQQKTAQKPKVGFPKAPPPGATTAITNNAPGAASNNAPPPVKSSLADWAATEDDDWMYAGEEKRPRGGRKKKKKAKDAAPIETDWDEIYDPSRPTNVDEYLRSDERIREVQEWKALLYRHKRPLKRQSSWSSSDEDRGDHRPMANQFAPPNSYAFAPPPRSPPRAATVPDDKTGDDAYARRLALSQGVAIPPPPSSISPPPPPPPGQSNTASYVPPPPPAEPDASTISRAPVRYVQPDPTSAIPAASERDPEAMDVDEPEATATPTDDDAPRSNLPGQRGFAARLMSKYGWSKGQGLGADNSGIAQPLRVQVEKRRKRPDSEGGGWAEPGGRGRIIDASRNNKKAADSDSTVGKFGPISPVIVLRRMLDNIEDLQHEVEEGLGQEIGEECGDNYGRVERLYIDVQGHNVYIKFVDQVSALRAVNALDGRVFAGSAIEPQYYNLEAFEKGVYE
ncbi:hypothetical protein PG990_004601 [Apiospora arundinis]